jgi:hypothetical protein
MTSRPKKVWGRFFFKKGIREWDNDWSNYGRMRFIVSIVATRQKSDATAGCQSAQIEFHHFGHFSLPCGGVQGPSHDNYFWDSLHISASRQQQENQKK